MTVTLPEVGPPPVVTVPALSDATTAQGIRVVAVRRPSVPLVHLRLHVPLGDVRLRDAVALRLLPKMLMAGTGDRTASQVAADTQRIGAFVDVAADFDDLVVFASGPAAELAALLDQVGDIIAHPSFPEKEVRGERERVVQEVLLEAADPSEVATRALAARLYPRHPYSDPLPSLSAVRRAGRGLLSRFHREHVRPAGSILVAVGDLDPARLAPLAGEAFGPWAEAEGGSAGSLAAPAAPADERAITLVHRPGAVQSNLRIGGRSASRHDPDFPALALAVTVFGGTFTSRLVDNLRERHGYTYSPRAFIRERLLDTSVEVMADVATEVTAPALAEIRYELARMATLEVPAEELDASRRYLTGVLAMGTATQAGLASMLGGLLSRGLDPSYLERFARELLEVDATAVLDASARYLAPARLVTALVGDADEVVGSLRTLDAVTVVDQPR